MQPTLPFCAEPLDSIARARLKWSKRIAQQMTDIAAEQGVPLQSIVRDDPLSVSLLLSFLASISVTLLGLSLCLLLDSPITSVSAATRGQAL